MAAPKAPKVITPDQQRYFIDQLIESGRPVAEAHGLPTAAMVACAIVESGYGTSEIYEITGCPFNLQRPKWYEWVDCRVTWLKTGTRTDAKGKTTATMLAPFCTAEGGTEAERLADASRIWCEWVNGWPQDGVRKRMKSLSTQPEAFAMGLPSLGFGEAAKRIANGKAFAAAVQRHALVVRCWI